MRIDRSFILMEASQTVGEGLDMLRAQHHVHYVILRREAAGSVYWYTRRADDFLSQLAAQSPDMPLQAALDMHEYTAVPQHRDGTADAVTYLPGAVVVNARGRLLGVFEPELMAPPQDSAGSVNAVNDDVAASPDYGTDESVGFVRPPLPDGGPRPPRSEPGAGASPVAADGDGQRGLPPAVAGERPGPPALPRNGDGELSPPPPAAPVQPVAPATTAPSHAPFAAWPDLVAPASVDEHETFTLEIGFARQRQAGVAGGPVGIVDAPPEFDLRVQLVGVGFAAPDGWTHDLHVVRDDPYAARLQVKLVAEAGELTDPAAQARTLAVQFYYESNLCGQAQRSIVVARPEATAAARTAAATTQPAPAGVPIRVKPGLRTPDLTVTVRLGNGRGQREAFVWSFESPHAISAPDSPAITELDQGAGAFVDALLQQLVELSDGPTADNEMRGIARQIERKVPPAFWIALKEAARAITEPRAPDVLFVTEETRLPWELAWMREPLDANRPNHLGAQVNFGRWILGAGRPALPPEAHVPWQHMVVVVGNYPASTGLALPDALEETKALLGLAPHATTSVELNGVDLDPFLEGDTPPNGAQLVHFACHGKSQAGDAVKSYLTMQNGKPFTPTTLEGSAICAKWAPFLFLNACEVGRAGVALGATGGFAGAALYEGCRAFVAPLWEVDSKVAHDIAIEFYTRTLDGGEAVAAVLRDVRSRYVYGGAHAKPSADTFLAYVYYGHPGLRLERSP